MKRFPSLVLIAWCLIAGAAAVFTVELEKGPVALHTWFQGKGTMLSAYYVYVTRN